MDFIVAELNKWPLNIHKTRGNLFLVDFMDYITPSKSSIFTIVLSAVIISAYRFSLSLHIYFEWLLIRSQGIDPITVEKWNRMEKFLSES